MWTLERKTECLEHWNTGNYSMSQLAEKYGVTRNSISGFLDRSRKYGHFVLGKQSDEVMKRVRDRSSALERHKVIRRVSAHKPKPEPILIDMADFNPPLRKNLFELNKNECKYPFGDKDFAFCGYPTESNKSFCHVHHAMCWQKAR